jgi:hypothetical protein
MQACSSEPGNAFFPDKVELLVQLKPCHVGHSLTCGWRVMRMTPVSHKCSFGSSTAATWQDNHGTTMLTCTRGETDLVTAVRHARHARCQKRSRRWQRGNIYSVHATCGAVRSPCPAHQQCVGSKAPYLQQVERGGIQKEERYEAEDPHQLVHHGLPAHIPQRCPTIPAWHRRMPDA